MHNLEFLIPIASFAMIVLIVKYITDNRTRQKLIDKGMVDEKIKYLFVRGQEEPMSSLKWGLVLIAIGVALTLNVMFPAIAEGPASIGVMFLFAGIAFIVYYMIVKSKLKE